MPRGTAIGLFDIEPQSGRRGQGLSDSYKAASEHLSAELERRVAPLFEKVDWPERYAGLEIKVLFALGRRQPEKDVDNMLKWFLDRLKEASVDDSNICDLRAMKFRLQYRDSGFVGLSLAVHDRFMSDVASAEFALVHAAEKQQDLMEAVKRRHVEATLASTNAAIGANLGKRSVTSFITF